MRHRHIRLPVVLLAGMLIICGCSLQWGTTTPAWKPKSPPLATQWTAEVSATNALPDYPRPQMVRAEWQNLNGVWQFSAAQANEPPPFGRALSESILVPFPVESALSGVQRSEERVWYRRTFEVPGAWAGRSVLLHFGAVDWQASVYVNGAEVGQKDREIKRLKQKVGELVMDVDILKEATKGHPSLRQMLNE